MTRHCSECGRETAQDFCAWHVFAPLETMTDRERQETAAYFRPLPGSEAFETAHAAFERAASRTSAGLMLGAALVTALAAHACIALQVPDPAVTNRERVERAARDGACHEPAIRKKILFLSFCG